MSYWSEISSSQVQGRGLKITEPEVGCSVDYVVRIDDIKDLLSRQGLKTLFIVEFTIMKGTERNPAGAQRSWVQMPEHRSQTDPGNIKAFIQACLGLTDPDAEVPIEKLACSVEGAYNGTILELSVEHVLTQSGRDFFIHTWRPYNGTAFEDYTLTKEDWLAGKGKGKPHPEDVAFEYCPGHPDFPVRKAF